MVYNVTLFSSFQLKLTKNHQNSMYQCPFIKPTGLNIHVELCGTNIEWSGAYRVDKSYHVAISVSTELLQIDADLDQNESTRASFIFNIHATHT